jgi:polysaccharide biosynthesis transport protein
MTDISLSASNEPDLGYGQLLRILWRRFFWFGGALVGSVGAAMLVTLLRSPTYESSMQLLVEPNVSRSISINSTDEAQPSSSSEVAVDYVTQLNLMRSKQFVEEVISFYPDVCESGDSRKDCIEDFRESLTLSQVEENNTQTRIFEAVFIGNDPGRVQKSLQALQNVYLRYNQEQQTQRLENGLALVNQQINQVQGNLLNSQQALQQFRQAGGTIDPEQQSLEAATAREQLVQTRQAVQADYQEAEAQYAAIQQALAVDPQQAMMASRLSESGRYQSLLDALQVSELALSERLAVYTTDDPVAQDLQAQRDLQVQLLQQESQRLLGGAAATNEQDLLANGQLGEGSLALVQEMVNSRIRLSGLEARAVSLAQAQQSLEQQLSAYPRLIAQYDQLQPEVETQRTSLEQLLQTRQELSNEIAQGGFKWAVVESPDLGERIAPQPVQNLAVGVIAGLFLGGFLAYTRESIDTVVRTSEDLKRQAALPLLGVLPEVNGGAVPSLQSVQTVQSPLSVPSFLLPSRSGAMGESVPVLSIVQREPFREAVDLIYKNIQLTATSLKSVMVTSAIAHEGKTTLAIALALSAARSHQRVLLIDADLRNPSLHDQLGLSNTKGFTTLLQSTENPSGNSLESPSPVKVTLASNPIDILPAGPLSEDPVRLLNSDRMKELIARFERQYDLVVFDTSALLGRVDALQIASLCSGVVMVSRLDKITQTDLSQATALLTRVAVLGVVANTCRSPVPIGDRTPQNGSASRVTNGATAGRF